MESLNVGFERFVLLLSNITQIVERHGELLIGLEMSQKERTHLMLRYGSDW